MNGLATAYLDEFRRIFRLKPAFSTLIVAALIYAVFYPQPYLNEALRDVPVAVVDQDRTDSSRQFARLLDATPDVAVAEVLPDLPSAQHEVFTRAISGIVVIPQHFERELLHGRPSPVALYGDASYFLIYSRVSGAVSAVAQTLGAQVEVSRLIARGIDPPIAEAAADPLPLVAVPLFNPQGGYATYILPAAFVLLVQQMLLIGTGLLNTLPGARSEHRKAEDRPGPAATVIGKALAHLSLEAVIIPVYLIVLPYLYGVPRLGSVPAVLAMSVPFILAVSGLGFIVAAIFKKPLAVQLAMAAMGLPFMFLAGFSWPIEAIPKAVQIASVLLPSTSAIDGIVRVSQLGGSLADVSRQFLTLWALALIYGAIAVVIEMRRRAT